MMITQNDIGKQFRLVGVADHTYTLVWYSQAPQYVDGRGVLWCGVVPSWSRTPETPAGSEYTVRLDNLRRIEGN